MHFDWEIVISCLRISCAISNFHLCYLYLALMINFLLSFFLWVCVVRRQMKNRIIWSLVWLFRNLIWYMESPSHFKRVFKGLCLKTKQKQQQKNPTSNNLSGIILKSILKPWEFALHADAVRAHRTGGHDQCSVLVEGNKIKLPWSHLPWFEN